MKSNQEFKNQALAALSGNWAQAVIVTIVFGLLVSLLSSPSLLDSFYGASGSMILPTYVVWGGTLLTVLVVYPLMTGFSNSFRFLLETGDNRMCSNMFNVTFGNWLHLVLGILVMYIYIFLWSLLFLIPGIIKSFSYAMTPYILVEHPELSINEAIDKSRDMMRGHKFDYFFLNLSFIGWILLAVVTLGIGFIWLMPYMQATSAAFYMEMKNEKGEGTIEAERVL